MNTLLQITSSLFGEEGVSSQLAEQFVSSWQQRHPATHLIKRDLIADPIPPLDATLLGALGLAADQRSPAQQAVVSLADQLIAELQQADIVVLGVPMYNFHVPSQLKSWFDYVARAGVTFRYTDHGAEGLLAAKPVYVFTSRGGIYTTPDSDGVSSWLRTMLGFLGLHAVQFVYAEGLNMGEAARSQGLAAARDQIHALLNA